MSKKLRGTALALIITYFFVSLLLLVHHSLGQALRSVSLLELGESEISSNPAQATQDFQASEMAAENSLGAIRNVPWWSRLLSELPPLRWQVELAKASYSLSQAGQSTLELQKTLTEITLPGGQDDAAVISATNQYLEWYAQNKTTISNLHSQLAEANFNLDEVPPQIFLGGASGYLHLKGQVSQLSSSVASSTRIADALVAYLAQPGDQTASIIFLPDSEATFTISNGSVSGLNFRALSLQKQAQLAQGFANNAFFTKDIATITGNSDILAVVQPQIVTSLLSKTGPITLSGVARPTISAESWNSAQIPMHSLFSPLFLHLLQHLGDAKTVLNQSIANNGLQLWSQNSGIAAVLPNTNPPPTNINWLRIVPGTSSNLNVSIEQVDRFWRRDTVQHVVISGNQLTTAPQVALPVTASVLNGSSEAHGTYQQAVTTKRNDGSYQLTYSLSTDTPNPQSITYLAPLIGHQTVTAFGVQQQIVRNTL